ncbi:MAG: helix-turn-helix domain-containing protein [Mycobacterium sp.]
MTSSNGPSGKASIGPQFVTVAEVAAQMRVSKMTVYRMLHNGELPAVRVGRSFRVPKKAFDELLASPFGETG